MRFPRPKATYERRYPSGTGLPLEYWMALDICGLHTEATAREYRLASWGLDANSEANRLRTALFGVLEFADSDPQLAKRIAQNAFDSVRDSRR
jgi:hypothetical protein